MKLELSNGLTAPYKIVYQPLDKLEYIKEIKMKIYYEDKNLIVAEKPSGVASQKDPSGRPDMISLLSEKCGCEIFCVHRLDTATEGVMVYAKDPKTAGRLTASLSDESAIKEYYCVVRAAGLSKGTMEDLLFHDKRKNKAYVVDRKRAGVKEAVLEYTPLLEADGLSLVKVRLHTGRTHQIRVQFASRKMPLVGDGKYGAKDNMHLALRCVHLSFKHPVTGKTVDTFAPPESPWFGFEASIEQTE